MSEGGVTAVEEALRLHPTWINGGGELPGPGGSVIAAMLAVAGGPVPPRPVLPHGVGVDLRHAAASAAAAAGGCPGPMQEWRAPFGAMSAANWIGMNANQYLHRYGATREMLGWIALNGRANAARNPAAIYRDPMTMDDYLSARPITTPFGLYDCDVPCDASIAVVVSDAVGRRRPAQAGGPDRGGRHPDHRAHLVGPGHDHPRAAGARPVRPPVDPHRACAPPTSTSPSSTTASRSTPSRGSRRSGFCGFGEAKDWLDGGRRIALDGDLPVNPHGGQLSEGRTHGFGFLYEAITQLRHEAGDRQVADARTAVVTSGGGTPSGVLLLRRDDA